MAMDLIDLSKKLQKRDAFPPIPAVVSEIIQEIDYGEISMENLSKLIQKDVCLATHLIRHANAGAYASAGPVSTVVQSIKVMGFRVLKGLCLSLPVFSQFRDIPGVMDLWRHSYITSSCCRIIAERIKLPTIDEAETAGLLHDLGKIFMYLEMPQYISPRLDATGDAPSEADWVVERKALGIDHSFIGARYGRMFNFPASILNPILWHHEPHKATANLELTHVCSLGDKIASIIGAGHPDFIFVETSLLQSLDYLGIRKEIFQFILMDCLERASNMEYFKL
jgi:HD-like signal output (HDOD) protein